MCIDKIKVDDIPKSLSDETIEKILSLVFQNKKMKNITINMDNVRIIQILYII